MKQTAVEWLIQELRGTDDKGDFIFQGVINSELIEQAKEMEKEQIIDARVNGVCEGIDIGARPIGKPITEDISKNHEIYYNETFKNK
jgi:hypothetical protein